MSAIPSAWDTSGPSQIAESFYMTHPKRGRGVAPNLSPRERKPRAPRIRPPRFDDNAIRAFILAGGTLKAAAIRFGCAPRTITNRIGRVKEIRPPKRKPKSERVRNCVKRAVYIQPEAWAWVLQQGGAPFLRKLVDNAMGAQ